MQFEAVRNGLCVGTKLLIVQGKNGYTIYDTDNPGTGR